MKYTRLEIKRPFATFKFKVIFEFCIVIPIVAMIFGSVLSKCLIAHSTTRPKIVNSTTTPKVEVSNKNKERTQTKSPQTNKKKQKKSLYYLQSGVFSSASNANVVVNILKNKRINSSVVKDKNLYRVVVDTSKDIKNIKDTQGKLKKIGFTTFIKKNEYAIPDNTRK